MRSLVEAARAKDYPAEIVCVISNRPDAPGISWAQSANIATHVVDHKAHTNRETFETAMQAVLDDSGAELIALAGFMRLLTPGFVARWEGRMINIHPSLLPAFKGLDTHQRALDSGVRIAGCTVHFVGPEMDEGPIIAQAAVPVLSRDTADTLAARVLVAEHMLYPAALARVAAGAIHVQGKKVVMLEDVNQFDAMYSPALPG